MHGMIAWFARNPVAANILMVTVIALGLYAVAKRLPLEVFPEFARDVVNITVPYPGSTPYEVEQGVILRVEDAIADLQGIDKVYSDGAEGSARIRAEVRKGFDVTKVMNEIKTRVDGISTFPDDAERPVIEQQTRVREVISVMVAVDDSTSEAELRRTTEQIRDEILNLPDITQADLGGVRPWEISINVPEATLRQYGLTLDTIAQAIRNASRDIPGGTVKTAAGEILVRTLGQVYTGSEFADIPVISRNDGTRIRIGEIATIVDGFNEEPLYAEFDGKKASFVNVSRVGDQNAIKLANTIKQYIEKRSVTLPANVNLSYWRDSSKIVKARLSTLTTSAIQGSILVFLLLALFLRPDLALWVSVGIPISFLGALALMPEIGVTLNIVSMFAFILVLGIVVDDAIVTGENVYTHLKRHNDSYRAAVEGTQEVSIPVTFGVLTTVAAFFPLLMLEGDRGPVFAQIPMIVIPVLLFSLVESKLILPAHLRHMKLRTAEADKNPLTHFQRKISHGLEYFVEHYYRPALEVALNWRYLTISIFIVILIISFSLVGSGRYKFTFFPRIQSERATATLQMKEGTPIETTEKYVGRIAKAAEQMQAKYVEPDGESIIEHILVIVGSTDSRPRDGATGQAHLASVSFEITPPEERELAVTSSELTSEWRKLIGPIPGVQELSFRAEIGNAGSPIDVQLEGSNFDDLNAAAEQVMTKLREYDGIFDIKNSFDGGKQEVQLRLRPEAEQLGLTLSALGTQVRHAIFGAEAQRIQRDQSEVKVMVRYPREERYSLADLQNLRIRTPDGAEIPLIEVADVALKQGTSKISRVNRQRILNVTADLNKQKVDANKVAADLKEWLPGMLAQYPGVSYDMEGERREQQQFFSSLMTGFGIALLGIYVLLAIPFKSYSQPLMVMSIIPFSFIGALGGHILMGMDISISSVMGFLALVGVVVNDSLVLVEYINRKVREGMPMHEAIRLGGGARFRPILLTSLTTFAGLTPLILEKSTQAQFLIPMAVSLGFGIMFATLLTLFLIPSLYLMAEDVKALPGRIWEVVTRKKAAV
ncbi:efflux RND transporter permease subunit [Thiothrix nivea]|uniref:Acriflavin resistance protein n=1 Tax=Thiothrix nivea (strain ATCC 35100 / DSM 5205 / JP2) TaxID=870187 RepID=A0A656HAH1_THINJ|nr:efflux RND transporter permease subunit [Thiothrix nivea]EIJ33102.1 acriflavin resistance protein [Thiothrix nivea DSM 5205]